MEARILKPDYRDSWAVVVGIDDYETVGPLLHACSDATAIADTLVSGFGFPSANVKLLLDGQASKDTIMESYLELVEKTDENDRVVFFFAGHGHTLQGPGAQVGYLVPVGGDPSKLHTLIRWDELTRNANLIPAKHVLFLMDSCYGGLAVQRSLSSGSTRYLRDMLTRPARQVLTAGKGDERVSDAGGPLEGHSVFTGFLLEGLRGKAKAADGVITANSLLPYVYQGVSRNEETSQTPHFGYLDNGDGDLIFRFPQQADPGQEEIGSDILLEIPMSAVNPEPEDADASALAKSYLASADGAIHLHDLVATCTRLAVQEVAVSDLPLDEGVPSPEEIQRRLSLYESATKELQSLAAVVGRWGHGDKLGSLDLMISRLVDFSAEPQGGRGSWLAMQWYPVMLLVYMAGIGAVHGENWEALGRIAALKAGGYYRGYRTHSLILAIGDASTDLHGLFQSLPAHSRNYVPRSEYLHTRLQSVLDDLFFLGASYDDTFDMFEAFFSLVHVDLDKDHDWSPLGRFAYRFAQGDRMHKSNPFADIIEDIQVMQRNWPPLAFGMFGGDSERAVAAATAVAKLIPSHWVM